jgi:hypothetical protein
MPPEGPDVGEVSTVVADDAAVLVVSPAPLVVVADDAAVIVVTSADVDVVSSCAVVVVAVAALLPLPLRPPADTTGPASAITITTPTTTDESVTIR